MFILKYKSQLDKSKVRPRICPVAGADTEQHAASVPEPGRPSGATGCRGQAPSAPAGTGYCRAPENLKMAGN